MKLKKISAVVLCVLLCVSLASCSGLDAKVSEKLDVTRIGEEQQQIEEILHEKIELADSDNNKLTVVPVFDRDGVTVIGGYVESAVDSQGNALEASAFELIGQVIALSKNEAGNVVILYDENNSIVTMHALFDEEGNIIALLDVTDVDKDGDKEEYFQVLSQIDIQDNLFIKLDTDENGNLINVTVEQEEDGTTAVVQQDGKKVTVAQDKPNSSSTASGNDTNASKRENHIILGKNSTAKTTAKSGVSISEGLVKITEAKNYVVTSDTKEWHGRIVVTLPNTAECEIRFENVNISYNKGNILQIQDSSIETERTFLETEVEATDSMDDAIIKQIAESNMAPNVDLVFPTGTSSTFHSTANSYTGVIYNESKLTLKGNGSLTVESRTNADNCLCSTKSVTIKNLTLDMTTAANTSTHKLAAASGSAKGIFSYGKVTIESGNVNIKTNGDAIRCDDFYCKGGVASIVSSACDAVDTDDRIHISGGNITCIALEKSAYKVRRVNNTVNGVEDTNLIVRLDENKQIRDYFKITAGTVVGESKKLTEVTIADQANILAKIKKITSAPSTDGAMSADDSSRRQIITIKNSSGALVKSSQNKCTKFLYSSYSLSEKEKYTAVGDSNTTPAEVDWGTKIGEAKIYPQDSSSLSRGI